MAWTVAFLEEFEPEFDALAVEVQDELLAQAKLLATIGPTLGRPRVDKLHGSKHARMKELRFDAADGVWRVAFAFDEVQQAILLAAGDKSGVSSDAFYKRLLAKADKRLDVHLDRTKKQAAVEPKPRKREKR